MSEALDDAVLDDVATALGALERMRRRHGQLRRIGAFIMALADDLNLQEDLVTTAITGIVAAFVADNATIVDLRNQLASGPPGLTAAQGDALLAKMVANQKTIADALAPIGAVTPPVPAS